MVPTPASLMAQGFTMLATSLIAAKSAKDQKELDKYLESLSQKQIEELNLALSKKESEMERQKLLFQSMAVSRNEELINQTLKKRIISFVIVGVAATILISLVVISRKHAR
jgi:hypothetical protein